MAMRRLLDIVAETLENTVDCAGDAVISSVSISGGSTLVSTDIRVKQNNSGGYRVVTGDTISATIAQPVVHTPSLTPAIASRM